jgi:PIN domain nuclease of toxin-antitoxin system
VRLLLDTHVLIAASRHRLGATYPQFGGLVSSLDVELNASVASVWEIAIKVRIRKLDLGIQPREVVPLLESLGTRILAIEHTHATALLNPEPPTRDPFDRLLLAQCQVEGLQLVTADRALIGHPLAWRPEPA